MCPKRDPQPDGGKSERESPPRKDRKLANAVPLRSPRFWSNAAAP